MAEPELPNSPKRGVAPSSRTQQDFLALFLAEQRRLYCFIRSLVPHAHDAEDILQETAAILWQGFDKFVEGTSFYAWGCKVAHYRILKHRHRWQQSAILLSDEVLEQLIAIAAGPQGSSDPRQLALEKCLAKLNADDKTIVTQRFVQQLPGREVAERLGRPANSVYKSLGRIRRALRACIGREMERADRKEAGQ